MNDEIREQDIRELVARATAQQQQEQGETIPLTMQKDTFRRPKGHLSQDERTPFATASAPGSSATGAEKRAGEAPQTTSHEAKAPLGAPGEGGGKDRPADDKPTADGPSLKEIIQEQATEGDAPISRNLTLGKVLGGDIFNAPPVRRQIWVFLLVAFFMVIYVANRYSCQKSLIEIDKLQSELRDAKYKALASGSQLTERTRESRVLELLKNNKDSVLHIAQQPPYIIQLPE